MDDLRRRASNNPWAQGITKKKLAAVPSYKIMFLCLQIPHMSKTKNWNSSEEKTENRLSHTSLKKAKQLGKTYPKKGNKSHTPEACLQTNKACKTNSPGPPQSLRLPASIQIWS